ncbi:hypothetical protein [Amycolatopsis alkalitolerans]|uniref:hypothetical protein n=1 Tax=Amycolatopsis alkalitolerans TaxID=2547244 RepID=UPI001F1AEAF7|nr:hypothetical protein [Amycolatopsis alkalitolerans]
MNPTEATLRSLHGIAELLLAGPQYRTSGRIRLRATPNGFGTTLEPDLRLDGDHLVAGERRISLNGVTFAEAGQAAGVEAGAPAGLYRDGSGARPDKRITLEPGPLQAAISAFAAGDEALRRFAPAEEPVLWPEHFDLAITTGEINYGVSPRRRIPARTVCLRRAAPAPARSILDSAVRRRAAAARAGGHRGVLHRGQAGGRLNDVGAARTTGLPQRGASVHGTPTGHGSLPASGASPIERRPPPPCRYPEHPHVRLVCGRSAQARYR